MFKLVINNKGKAYSKELNEQESPAFVGKKVKDKVSGNTFGFKGYEFEITGGSDSQGFPMRFDLPGTGRRRLLLTQGPCVKIKRKGMRKRKTVRGNTIAEDIKQINLNIVKVGDKKLEDLFPKKEEEKKVEEKKEVPKKEEAPKEDKKVEEKPKEVPKKEEKPKEEVKKDEPKKEVEPLEKSPTKEKVVEEKPKEVPKKEEEKK
tara:strand:+ start:1136 stop:1747 length:612 start_codon:yes stop_codon:yes gene_type:complete